MKTSICFKGSGSGIGLFILKDRERPSEAARGYVTEAIQLRVGP